MFSVYIKLLSDNKIDIGQKKKAGVIGIFHWHKILPIGPGPGVDSASNKNEYYEHFSGVKAAGA